MRALPSPAHTRPVLLAFALAMFPFTGGPAAEIHDAAAAGGLDKVRALVEADPASIESKDGRNNTPLLSACAAQKLDVAKFMIEHGADVRAKNKDGFDPLLQLTGSMCTDLKLIGALLDHGADVNTHLGRGLTPLHFAVMGSRLELARFLIEHGADLNAYDRGCYGTPLHVAANLEPSLEVARLLVERGADLNIPFSGGNTALHLAVAKGKTELACLLVQRGADVGVRNEQGRTPLYFAAKLGHHRAADALIAAGADTSAIAETNYGPAPQLAAPLGEGEAWLWYLGGLYGGGYAVKTREHLLVFDKVGVDDSTEAGLANGRLNPNELGNLPITLFVTKATVLNDNAQMTDLATRMPKIDWVLDMAPSAQGQPVERLHSHVLAPGEDASTGGLTVHAIQPTSRGYGGAEGLAYLLEADGLKILHTGFLATDRNTSRIARFRSEVDRLKAFAPIDIAILTVGGHLSVAPHQYRYLIEQLSPKAIYLAGGDAATEQYAVCAKALESCGVPVTFPEAGIAVGERFHFLRTATSTAGSPTDDLGQPPPGDTAVVFAPGIVSDGHVHGRLVITPDGRELFWTRIAADEGRRAACIMHTSRTSDGWATPEPASFATGAMASNPVLSPDGSRLYFNWRMEPTVPWKIRCVTRTANGWSEPADDGTIEPTSSFTTTGRAYFSSALAGKPWNRGIYVADLTDGGSSNARALPACINSEFIDYTPFIAPDESYLMFTSSRPSKDEKMHLHISFRSADGDWSEPVQMNEVLGFSGQARFPSLSPDGRFLFFCGDDGNIHWVQSRVIETLRK